MKTASKTNPHARLIHKNRPVNFNRIERILRAMIVVSFAAWMLSRSLLFAQETQFTSTFRFGDQGYSVTGSNPYMTLNPGYKITLEGEEDGHHVVIVKTVLDETEMVEGVETRVIEEYETKDGELAEISRNFFAICNRTNSVIYFGEDVDNYENGQIVSHDSAWRAGVDGAKPGIFIPGTIMLGSRFFQEVAPGAALDRIEILSMSETATVPAGEFRNCLMVEETTPLEPGLSVRDYYAPGVGSIVDGVLRATSIEGQPFFSIQEFQQNTNFTEYFMLEDCVFSTQGRLPYFILEPGHRLVYEGMDEGELIRLTITVLNETEMVDGVETRVVEEFETIDGEIYEVSRNYFAICDRTGSAYYFGEDVDFYEDGEITRHDGTWRAGVDGAIPGIQIPGDILVGARYFQEIAPDIAMDRAEILSDDETVSTPYGEFAHCVKTAETTPLEPDALEHKWYAPEIGLISDGVLELIEASVPSAVEQWELMR